MSKRAPDRLDAFAHADEAQALPPRRIDVEPDAIIRNREREGIRFAAKIDRHRPSSAVFQCVLHRLLHDAEQRQASDREGRFAGTPSCVNAIVVSDRESSRWRAWSAATRPISRSLVGCRRCERSCTLLARSCARFSASPASDSVSGGTAPSSSFEIDREQGDLLADIVVQFAGDARTFGVLGLEQPRPEIADALVAAAQRLLDRHAPDLLPAVASVAAASKPSDEERLGHQHRRCGEDVDLVAVPDGRFLEEHSRALRHSRLADAPTPQLSPVHLPDVQIR